MARKASPETGSEHRRDCCEQCFYSAWVPVETEAECAYLHPHSGEHVRCDYCWLKAAYLAVVEEDAPDNNYDANDGTEGSG